MALLGGRAFSFTAALGCLRSSSKKASPGHKQISISQHPSPCVAFAIAALGLYLMMIARAYGALSQARGLAWRPCFQSYGST